MAKERPASQGGYTATPQSSNVVGFGYNAESKTLTVTFKSGRSYAYAGVPKAMVKRFEQVKSKGKFLNRNLKDSFNATEVTDE